MGLRLRSPRLIAWHDQVLAILRDQEGFPLSTIDVGARFGAYPFPHRRHACPTCTCEHEAPAGTEWAARCWASRLYPLLDRMAKAGEIERVKLTGHARAYWRDSRSEHELAEARR